MGLGKTIQAIAIAKVYEHDWPLLVISPSSLRLVWRDELMKWLPDLKERDISVVITGKDSIGEKITIISYDLVCKMSDAVTRKNFRYSFAAGLIPAVCVLKFGQPRRERTCAASIHTLVASD